MHVCRSLSMALIALCVRMCLITHLATITTLSCAHRWTLRHTLLLCVLCAVSICGTICSTICIEIVCRYWCSDRMSMSFEYYSVRLIEDV